MKTKKRKLSIRTPQLLIAFIAMLLWGYGSMSYVPVWNESLDDYVHPASVYEQPTITPFNVVAKVQDSAGCARVKCIALTFDDGPNPLSTPQVLDVLDKDRVPATFFVVGNRAARQPQLLQRMYAAGFEVGNHSWNHADLTTLSPAAVRAEIQQTQQSVIAAGLPAPTLFRPPYGTLNDAVREEIPMSIAMWNGDPTDWKDKDPKQVVQSILAQAKPGGVLDLHDIYQVTAQALDPVIQQLKAQGYQFVTFSQMFDLQPGQRGEFFGRLQ